MQATPDDKRAMGYTASPSEQADRGSATNCSARTASARSRTATQHGYSALARCFLDQGKGVAAAAARARARHRVRSGPRDSETTAVLVQLMASGTSGPSAPPRPPPSSAPCSTRRDGPARGPPREDDRRDAKRLETGRSGGARGGGEQVANTLHKEVLFTKERHERR